MTNQLIAKINGANIVTVKRDNEIYVPIKPICDALGIDAKVQRRKLQEDDFFNSAGVIMTSTGADDKHYEMYCIRLRDVYGWLATINPGKVAPEAREAVSRYRRECYDALYEHFTTSMTRTIETNNAEIALLRQINAAISAEKEARVSRKKLEDSLKTLRDERLKNEPTLF